MKIEALPDNEFHQGASRITARNNVDFAPPPVQAFGWIGRGIRHMTEFCKRPKFWIGAIIILWLLYLIYSNSQPAPVEIHLVPWFVTLQLKLSLIIIGSGVAGVLITLAIQYFWRRRGSSKNAALSNPAPPFSSSTVA
jgi:uncharacterized integral membrane protein